MIILYILPFGCVFAVTPAQSSSSLPQFLPRGSHFIYLFIFLKEVDFAVHDNGTKSSGGGGGARRPGCLAAICLQFCLHHNPAWMQRRAEKYNYVPFSLLCGCFFRSRDEDLNRIPAAAAAARHAAHEKRNVLFLTRPSYQTWW